MAQPDTASRAATSRVKRLGREVGFDLVRVAPAADMPLERARYLTWIEQDRQAQMRWITRERAERSSDPRSALPEARSVICVGLSYWAGHRPELGTNRGQIARYAWGRDYHIVLDDKLKALAERLASEFGGQHRWYVDTGPLMDKALAARAGLGWYGKNTNILTDRFGSFLFLGEIVTTLQIEPDLPLERDCGTCRLCKVACPTGALGPDYFIDSRKCISYLTIEHRGPIPVELRPAIGAWVFGCDICQDVCPPAVAPYLQNAEGRRAWAAQIRESLGKPGPKTPSSPADMPPSSPGVVAADLPRSHRMSSTCSPERDSALFPAGVRPSVDLLWLLHMTHDQYVDVFRGSAIRRAKDWMLRRNAAVALGNVGGAACCDALEYALCHDEHPVVRGHAAWALGRLANRLQLADVHDSLAKALTGEDAPEVRLEITDAMTGCGASHE